MALTDIDNLREELDTDAVGHVEDHENIAKGLKSLKVEVTKPTVNSVNTRTGAVTLTKSDVGLSNVDNTTDANKPISSATQTALNTKVTTPSGGSDGQVLTKAGSVVSWTTVSAGSSTPDATSTVTGAVRLTGDLGGTATSPTVPGLATKVNTPSGGSDGQVLTKAGSAVTWSTVSGGTAGVAKDALYVNVKDHGATGNGSTNDTTAINTAYTAAKASNRTLYFPAGSYVITALPALADTDTIVGESPHNTTLIYNGTGTLAAFTNKQFISFNNIGIWLTAAGARGLQLSNCFRFSFNNFKIRGNHTGANTTFQGQIGIILDNNTGATFFNNCDINNLGYGLRTSCIQNEMVNCKFTVCWRSLHGVGGTANAGMYLTNTEFVGGDTTMATETHILIDGSANSWSLTNVWLEKGDYGAKIGVAGSGGPSQFAMFGCKVGARVVGLQFNDCRQPHLSSVEFDLDQGGTMTEVQINQTYAGEGVALNCVTTLKGDFAPADFGPYWFVVNKGKIHAGSMTLTGMGDNSSNVAVQKGYFDYHIANRIAWNHNYVHTSGNVTRATGLGENGAGHRVGRAVNITQMYARCRSADASGNTVVQLLKNGSATNMPSITLAAGSQVAGGAVDGSWSFASSDIITVSITSIGTTPGQGLTIDFIGMLNN